MQIKDTEDQFKKGNFNLPEGNFFVFTGSNNSGKSTLLRAITKTLEDSFRIEVNRTVLSGEGPQDKGYLQSARSYIAQVKDYTDDNSRASIQVLQDLFALKDSERKPILNWYNKYFPGKIKEEREDPSNSASPMLLTLGGFPASKQGSGIRATLGIFVKLFDPSIKILCIDEPELGLEPQLQKFLFKALRDKAGPEKKIFLATHSHHFLDRKDLSNNYICSRNRAGKISFDQITSEIKFRNTVFKLLGNELGDIGLPEKILIVEGISDTSFIDKAIGILKIKNFSIFGAGGDGNITNTVEGITKFLKFVEDLSSVYLDRIWIVVDKQATDIKLREWRRRVGKSKVEELPKKGIEYFYPERILQKIFNTGDSRDAIVAGYLSANPNSYNGISKSKKDLSKLAAIKLKKADIEADSGKLFAFLKTLPQK